MSRDPATPRPLRTHGNEICERQHKHRLTKSQAKSIAKMNERNTGRNVTAYRCRACGGWHVGEKRNYA